jgi:hypothetical protein
MTNTSREVGGVFGIALLGTILTTKLKSTFAPALATLGLPATQQAAIAASASHGTLEPAALRGLSPEQVAAVQGIFGQSFMDGFHLALIFGGCVLLVAAFVANRFIPSGAPAYEGRPAEKAQPIVAEV